MYHLSRAEFYAGIWVRTGKAEFEKMFLRELGALEK